MNKLFHILPRLRQNLTKVYTLPYFFYTKRVISRYVLIKKTLFEVIIRKNHYMYLLNLQLQRKIQYIETESKKILFDRALEEKKQKTNKRKNGLL